MDVMVGKHVLRVVRVCVRSNINASKSDIASYLVLEKIFDQIIF